MAVNQENIAELIKAQFSRFENSLNGNKNSSLHAVRREALALLNQNGLPSRKNEEYKYSFVSRLFERQLLDFKGNPAVDLEKVRAALPGSLSTITYVFVNGHYQEALSSPANVDGLTIISIQEGFEQDKAIIDSLTANNQKNPDGFNNLNNAFSESGIFIEVADNVVVEEPIVIISVTDSTGGKVIASPRHLAFIGENARASIADINISIGAGDTFSNAALEVKIGRQAVLDLYTITNEPECAVQVNNTYILQEDHSTLNAVTVDFNGKMIRNNLKIDLAGEYCEANLSGLYMPTGKSHIDNHTTVDHQKPNSNSNELYKGILDEQSTGVFNGKIFVRPDAQKTNAFQSNKNILLTDDATINTKPQLEIWADDVKCSHGCTTGQLDKDQLFYLRARGIDFQSARAMLLRAFAGEVIEQVKPELIRTYLESVLRQRIDIE
jgi:Fe-S cluster assembly protein SufD